MVGYRYYSTKKVPVLFPFGHGLSYTEFSIGNLTAEPMESAGGQSIRVTVEVSNTGEREGKETVQIYAGKKDVASGRPVRELKAFQKVFLLPGEKKTLEFILEKTTLACYDKEKREFVTMPGSYVIEAGHSAEALTARTECEIL